MDKEKETKKETKKEEKKVEEKKVEGSSRIDLAKRLNDITFKNEQVKMVNDLQSENAKLKQMMGKRGGKRKAETPRIQGLQTLKGNLGRQFQKRGTDY